MEKIIRNIRVGTDEEIIDDLGGYIKLDVADQEIVIRNSVHQISVKLTVLITMLLLWNADFVS